MSNLYLYPEPKRDVDGSVYKGAYQGFKIKESSEKVCSAEGALAAIQTAAQAVFNTDESSPEFHKLTDFAKIKQGTKLLETAEKIAENYDAKANNIWAKIGRIFALIFTFGICGRQSAIDAKVGVINDAVEKIRAEVNTFKETATAQAKKELKERIITELPELPRDRAEAFVDELFDQKHSNQLKEEAAEAPTTLKRIVKEDEAYNVEQRVGKFFQKFKMRHPEINLYDPLATQEAEYGERKLDKKQAKIDSKLEAQIDEIQDQIDALDLAIDQIINVYTPLKERKELIEKKIETTEKSLESLGEGHAIYAGKKAMVEQLKADAEELDAQLIPLQNKLDELEEKKGNLEDEKQKLNSNRNFEINEELSKNSSFSSFEPNRDSIFYVPNGDNKQSRIVEDDCESDDDSDTSSVASDSKQDPYTVNLNIDQNGFVSDTLHT